MTLKCRFDCIERPMKRLFFQYGKLLSRHPYPFIIVPLIIGCGLSFGFFSMERYADVEVLFTSERSTVWQSIEDMESNFPNNMTAQFLKITFTRKSEKTVTEVRNNDENDANIWTEEAFSEILMVDRFVKDMFVTEDSTKHSWVDVCYQFDDEKCPGNPVLQLFQYNASLVESSLVTFPYHGIFIAPTLEPVRLFLPTYLGKVQVDDRGFINSVEAFTVYYFTKGDMDSALEWEITARDAVLKDMEEKPDKYDYITMSLLSTKTLDEEIEDLTTLAMPLFIIAFTCLFTFGVLASLSLDWVIAKPWLSLAGLLSACFSIIAAFGLLLTFLPFTDMVTAVPFLAVGIGMDDMFVMISSWRKSRGASTVEERMCEAMSDAAVSITITTLTDLLAIGSGAISDIPSVRYFCIFAAVTVAFDYFFQITFFAGCMVLCGRREAANKHSITFQTISSKSEAAGRPWCFRFWCTGGSSSASDKSKEEFGGMVFMRDVFGKFITALPVKIFVCIFYVVYLGIAIWGCVNIKQGLEITRIVADDSYANVEFQNQEKYYREYNEPAYVVIYERLDYWKQEERDKVDQTISKYERNEYFHGPDISRVWTRDFDEYVKKRSLAVTEQSFLSILQEMFLKEPRYQEYTTDIKFDENGTIEASRFVVHPANLSAPEIKMEMQKQAVEIADNSDFNMTIVQTLFVFYESWRLVLPVTMQNFAIATAVVLVICILFIPSPLCSVYVALSIASMSVGLIGYMSFWDVYLDSISMIQIIMAVGFSVDFTAHITYAFCIAEGADRNERVRQALYGLGLPIIQSGLSTVLAILVLSTSNAYIFRVFFISLFLTMMFGGLHGLVFIPVVLSLIGPSPIDDQTHTNEQPKLHHIEEEDNPAKKQFKVYNNLNPMQWPQSQDSNPYAQTSNGDLSGPVSPNGHIPEQIWTTSSPHSSLGKGSWIAPALPRVNSPRNSIGSANRHGYDNPYFGPVTLSQTSLNGEAKWNWESK